MNENDKPRAAGFDTASGVAGTARFKPSAKDTGVRDTQFYRDHRQRSFYIRTELNDALKQQQRLQGRGTTHQIVNDALEMYLKKKGYLGAKK